MAKPLNLGAPSRFSLLKIDDDDDEEDVPGLLTFKNKKSDTKSKTGGTRPKFVPISTVSSSTSQKQKKKSGKKNKPSEFDDKEFPEDGTEQLEKALEISRATFEAEQRRRCESYEEEDEDTKRAIEESFNEQASQNEAIPNEDGKHEGKGESVTIKARTGPAAILARRETENGEHEEEDEEDESEIGKLVKETNADAKRILAGAQERHQRGEMTQTTDTALYKLYKTKFEKAVELCKEHQKETCALKEKFAKAKARNKQYCDILADAETREKAELVHSVQKTAKLNEELMQQLTDQHKVMEKYRSRVHELENEQQKKPSKSNK